MGKKVREYKSGDFIFAKVKGYPAWPARVQKLNGKKYFVYFYGTGETANLPPNMIFDYVENKDKFLTKTVKRRDFNDGVKQIEYDFANNVPLEQVIGVPMEVGAELPANDTANDSAIDTTMDDTTADDTVADETADDTNATQNDGMVEDSDEAGALVIDEGKAPPTKGKKSKADAKTPAKETPKSKEPKTPRGKGKKEDAKEKDKDEENKTDEELVSRSGRKIRPKRYIDEQTEDNATLPSPAPKRRRGASPAGEKEKADGKEKERNDKTLMQFNAVKQSELEGLKEPFKPADEDKDNILIAYLPTGTYVGIKLFQSRPNAFKNESSRLQWDKQAAANAITLKMQLERDQITPQSVQGQLVMDLNLTDEEKATLDKERETEEKKSRVTFLKTEMKLIELDAKIKTCLCLEKADTELCLKLLDEMLTLDVKPLMLYKHPACLETVKRMRSYVGNTPSWDLSESAALAFSKQAHTIRKKADQLYKSMKSHFQTPDGLSFWEYFSEREAVFREYAKTIDPSEVLEMVHEPLDLFQPIAHTMRAAIDQANSTVPPLPPTPEIYGEEEKTTKKKGKAKKAPAVSTPSKSKRQSSRNKPEEEKTAPEEQSAEAQKPEENPAVIEKEAEAEKVTENNVDENAEEGSVEKVAEESSKESSKEPEIAPEETNADVEMAEPEKSGNDESSPESPKNDTEEMPNENEASEKNKDSESNAKDSKSPEKNNKDAEKPTKEERSSNKKDKKSKEDRSERNDRSDKNSKSEESDKSGSEKSAKADKSVKETEKSSNKSSKDDKHAKETEKKDKRNAKEAERSSKDSAKNGKESEKSGKDSKEDKSDDKADAKSDKSDEKQESGEHRAKRSRENKKTEPPSPRSPAKRKSKF